MRRQAALLPMVLAVGATILVPGAKAREPTPIKACQTISQPGSYELANNITATGDCLVITADFVTIDLAGFLITGPSPSSAPFRTGILASPSGTTNLKGITVRNGSVSRFTFGVDLTAADGSIVEGLRVSENSGPRIGFGILTLGIVRGNVAVGNFEGIGGGGTISGNYATGNIRQGIGAGSGSTVIGNTAVRNGEFGFMVGCPSNLTDNTAVENGVTNLVLNGADCHNEDNLAP